MPGNTMVEGNWGVLGETHDQIQDAEKPSQELSDFHMGLISVNKDRRFPIGDGSECTTTQNTKRYFSVY